MSDLKPCPNPKCRSVVLETKRGHPNYILCVACGTGAFEDIWNALPRRDEMDGLTLLRRVKELADAGDPRDGCWESGITGERVWRAWIDDHLYTQIEAALLAAAEEAGCHE